MASFLFKKQDSDPGSEPDSEPDLFPEDIIRAEMVPGSKLYPEQSWKNRIFLPSRLYAILVILGVLGVGWICFAGPGAPLLESFLSKMAARAFMTPSPKPTATKTPSQVLHLNTPTESLAATTRLKATATHTPLPSPFTTAIPTRIETATLAPTPTIISEATRTPTLIPTTTPVISVQGCIPAISVKVDDVGKTLCVTGNVLRTDQKTNSFLIILEDPKDAFYFLSYDRAWENLKPGDCVYATGKILQLGDNPVMVLSYSVPLEYCP